MQSNFTQYLQSVQRVALTVITDGVLDGKISDERAKNLAATAISLGQVKNPKELVDLIDWNKDVQEFLEIFAKIRKDYQHG